MDIESLWRLKNFVPNEKQKEAILHVDGPLFLTAGPGSGKTRVLLWRTLNLIVFHNVKPEEIFLSTFTKKAAYQLKEGLKNLLSLVTSETGHPFDISKMALGTVHSICHRILSDRRLSSNHLRKHAPQLIDELSQYLKVYNRPFWIELIKAGGFSDEEEAQRAINEFFTGRDHYSRHFAVLNSIKLFNRLSEENYGAKTNDLEDTILNSLLEMYQYYRYSLKASNSRIEQVDFSLIQQEAYSLIRSPDFDKFIFKHVIIDEYQDTNPIQEKLFFELARESKNICIVGDDDQALYRFRGATVENLVEFESRCEKYLGVRPKRIDLNINYRSRKDIVNFYKDFIERIDWSKEDGKGAYRIVDKKIQAANKDSDAAVYCAGPGSPDEIYSMIANFILELKKNKKIEDYNQVAFLFPALKKSTRVTEFKRALEGLGIPVYAPRAGRFLDVEEARVVWGIFFKIFGRPSHAGWGSQGIRNFRDWTKETIAFADSLIEEDKPLKQFIKDKQDEIERIKQDYEKLITYSKRKKWSLGQNFKHEWRQKLANVTGISAKARRLLGSKLLARAIELREKSGNPYSLNYIINRVTSVDWTILDLFYQLNAFDYFKKIYQLAEEGIDEGPICNLGLITQYLAKYMEYRSSILTGAMLVEKRFVNSFFSGFSYALFRLGETEYEFTDDPFPKGRVPFLSIHQAKGLEFPFVILGSVLKRNREPDKVEVLMRDLFKKDGEPLHRINEFDKARMFYVALSRAKYLMIIPYFKGRGQQTSEPFKTIFSEKRLPHLRRLDIKALPDAKTEKDELGKSYSYTNDFLAYLQCPRNYMIFRKYGFAPSRSQTMIFGRLVHQTIEDLHHLLIQEREKMSKGD